MLNRGMSSTDKKTVRDYYAKPCWCASSTDFRLTDHLLFLIFFFVRRHDREVLVGIEVMSIMHVTRNWRSNFCHFRILTCNKNPAFQLLKNKSQCKGYKRFFFLLNGPKSPHYKEFFFKIITLDNMQSRLPNRAQFLNFSSYLSNFSQVLLWMITNTPTSKI